VPTSFQAEVLAKQYGIPLTTHAIDHIDIAIDGADEVDPQKEFDLKVLSYPRENCRLSRPVYVVVDSSKIVIDLVPVSQWK